MSAPAEWPARLIEAHRVLEATLVRLGITGADKLATAQVLDMSAHFGGAEIYWPKNVAAEQAERDASIWERYTGRNKRALAEEYGLSERTIERIVERERAERQGSLFPAA